jgi:DNA helicase-2/ATP-dependent DNA helicase PcrA
MITKPRTPDLDQDAAVDATDDVIVVSAGPGSGKTHTLARRARRLLLADADSGALMLAFTNKAAEEMQARAGIDSDRIYGSTFHGFGTELLSRHADVLDMDTDFVVIDDDQRDFLAMTLYDRDRFPDPLGLRQAVGVPSPPRPLDLWRARGVRGAVRGRQARRALDGLRRPRRLRSADPPAP